MSFEGFTVEYLIPDYGVNRDTQPAIITCEKCGTWSLREQKYMWDTCEEITCSKCGHKASRNYTEKRSNDTPEESVIK